MLTRPLARRRTDRLSPTRFRPRVEGLEGREVPATLTWIGGYSSNSLDPRNWDLGQAPTDEDSLVFDGMQSCMSCNLEGGWLYESVSIINGYSGTVALLEGLIAKTLVFDSVAGKISQPFEDGCNIYFSKAFNWTGGTLNSSDNHSYVVLEGGATASITPLSGAALVTGSTLSFENSGTTGSEGTFNPGTIQFNNGANLNVGAFSKVDINPSATVPVKFQNPDPNKVSQTNVADGVVTVTSGKFEGAKMPVNVTGGTFKILDPAIVVFSGQVGGVQGAGSVEMSAGNIAIQHGAEVTAGDNGMKLSGGVLTTLKSGDGAQRDAVINGTIVNSGADITPLADALTRMFGDQVRFGKLVCGDDVTWTGGAYRPAILIVGAGDTAEPTHADVWGILGKLTVGGSAKVGPVVVGLDGTQQQTPAAGQRWIILYALDGITAMPGVDPNSAWAQLGFENGVPPDTQPKKIFVET